MESLRISNEKEFFDTSIYTSININSTFSLMDCSNSNILDSFTKSRKQWISSVFDSVPSNSVIRTPLGSCTLMIGPHVFANSQFYRTRVKLSTSSSQQLSGCFYSPPRNVTQISTPPTSPISSPTNKFDIVFELEDSPGVWWLLPMDIKLKTQSLKEPYQVTITIPPRLSKSLPDPFYQQARQNYVYIFGVQKELWAELQLALIDFCVDEKYETYHHRPKIILEHPKNPTCEKYYSLSQSDSDSDFSSDPWGSSPCSSKLQKVNSEAADKTPDRVLVTPKRVNLSITPSSGGIGKKCGYCGCKSTPMWRRGPAGPGTLCNACGVKWKHGKIMQEQPIKYEKLFGSSRGRSSSSRDKASPVVLIDSRMARNTTPASTVSDSSCVNE